MKITLVLKFIFILTSTALFISCVSVGFKSPKTQKSDEVIFSSPDKNYDEVKSQYLDKSWRDRKTGATISYLSDCNNPTDPSLESIFKGITSEIDEVNVIESNHVDFNSRDALHSQVEGNVDGIATRFELMIFKKNNCTYILTYAAEANAYAIGQRDFSKFVKGFVVP
jgi:hypothetical protein